MKTLRDLAGMPGLSRIAGAVLLLAGSGLVAWTERQLIAHEQASAQHGGQVLDLGQDGRVQGSAYGRRARVAGKPQVAEMPYDADFGQRAQTPVLWRRVEMFQWREVRVGEQVHYELDWVDHPLDSHRFAQPDGHANPGHFPVDGKQFDAGLVRMNGLSLAPELIHALPGGETVAPDMKTLPANMAATFSRTGDYLTTSARLDHPRLGDLRIHWEIVPPKTVTLFARIDGDRLVPAPEHDGDPGFEVQVGDRSLTEVRPQVPPAPTWVGVRRVLAVLLGMIGMWLLLPPARRRMLLGAGAGVLVITTVAGCCWIGVELVPALWWLLFAVLGCVVVMWRMRRRAF